MSTSCKKKTQLKKNKSFQFFKKVFVGDLWRHSNDLFLILSVGPEEYQFKNVNLPYVRAINLTFLNSNIPRPIYNISVLEVSGWRKIANAKQM